jgi:hypothetical protein
MKHHLSLIPSIFQPKSANVFKFVGSVVCVLVLYRSDHCRADICVGVLKNFFFYHGYVGEELCSPQVFEVGQQDSICTSISQQFQ